MRTKLLLILLVLPFFASTQNIQFHYDFGKAKDGNNEIKRDYVTTTLDYFKPDKLGSTFFFVDIDYNNSSGGASLAYFEIARKFTLHKQSRLSLQIEYNDGSPDFIDKAWLFGFSYPIKIGETTIYASLLYKAFAGADNPDAQLTLVWNQSFFNKKITFSGFIDIWSQDEFAGDGKNMVILSEPQFWYNINQHFSIGGEIEISKNQITFDEDFELMPTLAIKWNL